MATYNSFLIVGGFTLISRALGFIRDILIAAVLGSGSIADAFFVAFKLPNLFRRLFGEGALNAAFVPLFASKIETRELDSALEFAEDAISGLSIIMLILSVIAIISMPWLVFAFAPGFTSDPEKFELAVSLSRITFPYLLCMSLVAVMSGVLNTYGCFLLASAAPISLNVVIILSLVFVLTLGFTNLVDVSFILATSITIAGMIQFVMLWCGIRNVGIKLKFRLPRYNENIKNLINLGIPSIISGGITQINILVGTIIASLQTGAVSFLYYADRLYQLPLGVVGITISVVLLPDLSRKLRAGNVTEARKSQNRSLEFALLLTIPASVALVIAADPIIFVLFERGTFTAADTTATAQALVAFAIGLPAFVLIKVLQPAFFARENTATPMWFAVISMIANILGSLVLFYWFKTSKSWMPMPHVGIALATSIAGWTNMLLLWWKLAQTEAFYWDLRLVKNIMAIFCASFIMGGILIFILPYVVKFFISSPFVIPRIIGLSIWVATGVCVFFVIIMLLGRFNMRQMLQLKH
ncbi:MAG: putative lipid II flippase MurJ [Hyphomicrobiaceae bacterium hypho_1]